MMIYLRRSEDSIERESTARQVGCDDPNGDEVQRSVISDRRSDVLE